MWNLVEEPLGSTKGEVLEALPGIMTYLFGNTAYLDGNKYSILAGGGGCAADQADIAVKAEKMVRKVVLKEGAYSHDRSPYHSYSTSRPHFPPHNHHSFSHTSYTPLTLLPLQYTLPLSLT